MFSFEDLNTSSKKTIRDGITLDGMAFVPLKDYIGKELKVDGFFFTNGKYGEQVVIVADGKKVNIPKRFTETFKKIRDNDESLEQVIAGKLVLSNIREIDSQNGKTGTFDYKTI